MKKLFFMSIVSAITSSAFAMQDLYCNYAGLDNQYSVSFQAENASAFVMISGVLQNFGLLKCTETKMLEGFIYECNSTGVTDAGYRLKFFWEADEDFTVDVYEKSIRGEIPITTLPCSRR